MRTAKFLLLLFLVFAGSAGTFAQTAIVKGIVRDSLQQPLELVTVMQAGTSRGMVTDITGSYRLEVPANEAITIVVRHSVYQQQSFSLQLAEGKVKTLDIELRPSTFYLEGVEITGTRDATREQSSTLNIDPKALKEIPTPFLDFNQALASGGGLGIVGNNELSSSYSVRGGNFDENLVYVNNIQIYRPFLVRAGQQEGLSFIQPELVDGVEFSSGGWQPKYGDKLSSVLNVTYKKPTKSAGSLTAGLLGGALHWEGASNNQKVHYVVGARHKSARYLLNTLETDGQYLPRFTDMQGFMSVDLTKKGSPANTTTLDVLLSYARNRYELVPESRVTNFGTFQRLFRLSVAYVGAEELSYNTLQGGINLTHKFGDRYRASLILSAMSTREREFVDVEGGYRLCDVDNNLESESFNDCIFVRGIGSEFSYARNFLEASIYAAEWRNEWMPSDNFQIEWGARLDVEDIDDRLYEYAFLDSADFVAVTDLLRSNNSLQSQRVSGYLQGAHFLGKHTVTYGVRANYWSLNQELLVSPRLQYAFDPGWTTSVVFNAAVGLYHQPPFYRELRDFDGNLNLDLKAQRSLHAIVGMDLDLFMWGRPFKLISEAYHKRLWNVVPYDLDNVRVRYYANNDAEAQVWGTDVRLSGEFIPNTESWLSLSILSAREDVGFDTRGDIRRPSDQRVTFSVFFRDHLPNDPSIRVFMRTLYGSGLPFGPPQLPELRNSFKVGTRYLRSDIGFSKVIPLTPKNDKNRFVRSVWIGLEVLNLFGVDNRISFNWIPDFAGNQFAVPNSLSQRFFNLRMVLKH